MSATIASVPVARSEGRHFYLWMAAAFIVVAFGGFIPTYWAPVATGSYGAPPVLHVHAALMFVWTCFFFAQTAFVANGRTITHRALGLFGIGLFGVIIAMIPVGVFAVLKHNELLGFAEAGRRFAAVPLMAWPVMAGLFGVAIANIHRPQIHKRLMIVLMSAMMTPAIARLFLTFLAPPGAAAGGPPPPFIAVPPGLVADLFIVAALIYDWRTRGRPHPAYLIGGGIVLAQQLLTVPIAMSDTWMRIITGLERIGG